MSDAMTTNTTNPRLAAQERRRALSQNGGASLAAKQSASAKIAPKSAAMGADAASGQSLSRMRRQALSQVTTVRSTQASPVNQYTPMASENVRVAAPVMEAPASAQAATSSEGCGCKGKGAAEVAEREQAIEAVCAIVDAESGPVSSAVRKLCQQRRSALSSQGKTAVKSSSSSAGRKGGKFGAMGAMSGLSGRDAARARREEMCVQGRGDGSACRPSGRVRPKLEGPVKVEMGTTLRGTGVTGTQVERNEKITGNEPGSCRAITGTEYIGTEQYAKLCVTTPAPAAAKVGLSTTTRGQRVSGTEVGRSLRVTGNESGTGKAVTGTEYIGAEQFEQFGGSKPVAVPAKVSVISTRAGQSVSGTEVGRSSKVTGDELGSGLKLTGSQYVQDQSAALNRNGSGAPHKVSVMSTLKDRPVTGTDVATGGLVTGAERGLCAGVTGTESGGLAQYQGCNREPIATPEKTIVMRTWRDQQVSGTAVEHSNKVTGDEYGGCQPISGTSYIGPDQYVSFCDADRQAASRALMSSHGAQANMALTGLRIGSGDKMTGAARGESQLLSGTPYSGSQQRVSQQGSNNNPHPLSRSPANAPRVAAAVQQPQRVQGNFSIATPARSAHDSSMNLITGTAYGSNGRITGPVNLAAGLVSGTSEFRHQDASNSNAQTPAVEEPRSRMTGDGREGGFAITGAAWRRNENITGTEGFSARRNPTLRGESRAAVGALMGAAQQKSRERVELPMSKVTGSSGTDAKGSAITYSGGARG